MNSINSEEIINGFIDAGCNKEQIEIVKKNISNHVKLIEVLVELRKEVLDKIHEDEDRMKCIDYLIYELKREIKEK